ncbi:hypothetical protein HNY73_006175 [Argiope bruennichi]|uniref:Uncharacterized protein n=1 Tax=Argiope bruennichi TaxID=94029 RepID=A0A8T0FJ43_ARGBR|nr:hypothetical protein HNY73_006175 [Argiope bruennichi]
MTSRSVGLAGRKRMVEKQLERERKFQKDIESFFVRDDVSRNRAGTKETITKNKMKKQKRFLNAPIKTLYKKFLREVSKKVSYTTFTRYRPFHVLKPTDIGQDTCLCKTHTNIELKAKKLKQFGLLSDNNPHALCELITCNKNSVKCMYNNCVSCKNKILPFSDTMINAEEKILYEKGTIVKETVEKTDAAGKKIIKENKKSKKIIVTDTISRLKESFQKDMKDFKRHLFNIKNQNREFKSCKENLMDNEAAILVDFSENYSCKLAKEIQSYHFVDTIHIFSDGPSTQYRQKKNFFLFSTRLFDLTFVAGTWSFFESSHGKGAADGVGSALKRKANDYVAYRKDIPDARILFETLKDTSEKERNKKLREVVENDLKVFKLQAEIRRNNEQQLEQELGLQKSLSDFQRPVTEKLRQNEHSRKEHLKAITNSVASIPLAIENIPPAIEHSSPSDIFNFDRELDVEFLEKNNFPRPSKLYYESKKALQEIINKVNKTYMKMARQKGNVMSQIARMTRKDEEKEDVLLDRLPKKMRQFENGIINLDIATGPGTHWVCYYNDPNNSFVEYFDPFGEYVYKILPNVKKYLQSSGKKEIGYNSNFLQQPSSVKCGYFCMKYISERNNELFRDGCDWKWRQKSPESPGCGSTCLIVVTTHTDFYVLFLRKELGFTAEKLLSNHRKLFRDGCDWKWRQKSPEGSGCGSTCLIGVTTHTDFYALFHRKELGFTAEKLPTAVYGNILFLHTPIRTATQRTLPTAAEFLLDGVPPTSPSPSGDYSATQSRASSTPTTSNQVTLPQRFATTGYSFTGSVFSFKHHHSSLENREALHSLAMGRHLVRLRPLCHLNILLLTLM